MHSSPTPHTVKLRKSRKSYGKLGRDWWVGREGQEVSGWESGARGQEAPLARGALRASSEPACPGCPGPAPTQKETFLSRYV